MDAYIVEERLVLTAEESGWPVGLLTAHETGSGGIALEHVVTFPGAPAGALCRMLRLGLRETWRRQYRHVTFSIPHAYPVAAQLVSLAGRFACDEYARDEFATHFVTYRPTGKS